jgi:hypothetical protein
MKCLEYVCQSTTRVADTIKSPGRQRARRDASIRYYRPKSHNLTAYVQAQVLYSYVLEMASAEPLDRGSEEDSANVYIPELKSSRSTSATLSPLLAASTATPAPVAPPPTTRRSNSSGCDPSDAFFEEALKDFSMLAREGGVHDGGGLLVSLVDGG